MKRILMFCIMLGAVVCGVHGINDPTDGCTGVGIWQQPASQTNSQGATVTFTVVNWGSAPVGYQWQKQQISGQWNNLSTGGTGCGSTISINSGSTASQLTISNVCTNDAGSYQVILTNACNTNISSSATLIVHVPPMITQQPTNQTVIQGSNMIFTVTASGAPPLSYQWTFNGTNISWGTGMTLTLTNVQANQAGTYAVLVSNSYGSILSSNAVLTVNGGTSPPSITIQPHSQTVVGGGTASFSVTASGALPLSYQWDLNGTNISWATNATLTLTNVQLSQAGTYTVLVTNAYGSVLSSNAVLTLDVMVITRQPADVTANEGGSATFRVTVTGTGHFNYQWQFDGTNLDSIISTVAGNGGQGDSGDGGLATAATLYNPAAVAVDAFGNLFIADAPLSAVDPSYSRIRKVDTNGIITTVAGGGTVYPPGNGAKATSEELYFPSGVAADNTGNLFIADEVDVFDCSGHSAILRVDTNGNTTVVAGGGSDFSGGTGCATNAGIDYPCSVAVDTSGNLFIAEPADRVIRKVGTNGIITIVAGVWWDNDGFPTNGFKATNAILNEPSSVAVDISGNLFIADAGNNVICKVDPNGIITTIAGNGSPGYSGDGGAATNAMLSYPQGIAVDASGNVLIANWNDFGNNNVVRKVDINGIITTVAGNNIQGYSGDGGAATNATLCQPNGLAVDAFGNLFIADMCNNLIRKVQFAGYPTLTLYGVTTNEAGNYSVVITNPRYGSVTSSNAVLRVIQAPVITQQPANQTVNLGGTATFTVAATGTTPSYQWYCNNQWYFNPVALSGATNSTLTLTGVQITNAGNYYVVVFNAAGSVASSNVTLTVLAPPSITQQPTNQTACAGDTVILSVAVNGAQPLSYQWQFNGTNLPDATNSMLVFDNVQTNSSGNYTATVTNSLGSVTSSIAVLTVLEPPTFTTQPTDQTAIQGADVVFTVEADGTPPLSYQWYFNFFTPLAGATNSTLTLANVQLSQAGSYSVIVSGGSCGSLSSNAVLVVEAPMVLSGSLTNYTFQSGTTYYLETTVELYGVTTIEGGAVIKYASQPAAQLTLNGPLVCLTGPSTMAFLTSKDDNSVGITIAGSTGNPGNSNGGTYLLAGSGQTNEYRFLSLAYAGTGISGSGTVDVRDSQFVHCRTAIDCSAGVTVTLMNDLFNCSALTAMPTGLQSTLALSNNLVLGTTVNLPQPPDTIWYAFNNDFDTCIIANSTLINGYNAYLNCNGRLYPTNVNDVVTNVTLAYQTSWLGSFYQPTNSPLLHAGSTTADQVGLYHYTVTTNQVVEGTNIVSIGFHYVATDACGNPLDTDGDGIPDYLEDANGNGLVDNGEPSWLLNNFNGLSSGNGLQVFTPLK